MKYEQAVNNVSCKKVLNFFNKKLSFLDYYERQNFKQICLWEACKTFNPEKGVLFITHLYTVLKYGTLKEFAKYKRFAIISVGIFKSKEIDSNPLPCNVYDHINSLLPIHQDIIEKRFIIGLSIIEIASEYNISVEECKKIIAKAKKSLKNSLTDS